MQYSSMFTRLFCKGGSWIIYILSMMAAIYWVLLYLYGYCAEDGPEQEKRGEVR